MKTALMFLVGAVVAFGAPPRIANAKLETRTVAAGLEKDFRALVNGTADPAWIGYAVPSIERDGQSCCSENGRYGCALESGRLSAPAQAPGPVKLESRDLLVLFRVAQRAVDKIRTASDDCPLDAGGLTVYWLEGVRPAESVALLAGFATGSAERRIDAAVAAIALHADPSADAALEKFVAPSQPEQLREKTPFWLGAARGRRGYEMLRRLAREDPSDQVRDKAVFALTVSKEPQAVDALIETARSDKSARVRGQALFWLAQKAGKKAEGAITNAVENDPDTEVKKRAVFALSQLPKDEGVPLLIQVARTNRNPAVRKQAMFWLGQSRDIRALQFFEEVLK